MAYENKYQKYLNKKEPSSPSFVSNAINVAGKTVAAAALLGGGYYGLRYLGVGEKAKEFLDSDTFAKGLKTVSQKINSTDAYFSGLSETLHSSGIRRVLSGRAEKELQSNIAEQMKKVHIGDKRAIGGDITALEKQLYALSKNRKNIGQEVVDVVRKDNVIKDINERFKGTKEEEFVAQILSNVVNLEKSNKAFMDYSDTGARKADKTIQKILEKHKVKQDITNDLLYARAEDALKEILPKHKLTTEKQRIAFKEANNDVIQKQLSAINKQYNESIVESLKKQGLISKGVETLGGFKKVTVDDALEQELLKTDTKLKRRYLYKDSKDKKVFSYNELDAHSILKNLSEEMPEIKDAFVDPMIFMSKSGNILDMRAPGKAIDKPMGILGRNFQVPFVNIKPFGMINNVLGIGKEDTPVMALFRSGSVMPTINNSKEALSQDYFYLNGRVVNQSGELVKKNQYLVSSTRGPWQRALKAQGGFTINQKIYEEPKTVGEWIRKSLSLGYQDYPSSLEKKLTGVTKFGDERWERNIFNDIRDKKSQAWRTDENLQNAYKMFSNTVDSNTTSLDRDTLEMMSPYLSKVLDSKSVENLIHGSQQDSVLNAIAGMIQKDNEYIASHKYSSLKYRGQLEYMLTEFMDNPDSMSDTYRFFKKRKETITPEALEAISSNSSQVVTKIDHAEKILHAELLNQIERTMSSDTKTVFSVGDMVEELVKSGATVDQISSINALNVHKEMRRFAGPYHGAKDQLSDDAIKSFSAFLTEPDEMHAPIRENLEKIIYKANPKFGYGPGKGYTNPFKGNEYIVMGESHPIQAINDIIKDGGNIYDIFKKAGNTLGFGKDRVGRNHLDETSKASNIAYYYLFRLNEGLSKVGIGLNYEDLGSTQDIFKNLMLKRVAAPLAAIGAVSYLNDETANITGERPTQALARSYANITVGVQTVKEVTGVNAFSKYLNRLMPGSQRLIEGPGGVALKFGTFGIVGENRSPREMREYYTDGVDSVRKGRYWSIGSSTPIYGDKIKYFQPNWYRRIQADATMTDVMYGSTNEYWANHILPNPRNPLGALNPFTWGHWERKHWKDRPYPTSSSGLEAIPLVGPALDLTAGRIFKPFRRRPGLKRAHEDYLTEINSLYAYYAEQQANPGYVYITPGGRMTPSTVSGDQVSGTPIGTSTTGMGAPGAPVATEDGMIRVIDPSGGFSPMQSGSAISQKEITRANMGYVDRARISSSQSKNIQSLRDSMFVENLDSAIDPNSLGFRLGETYYSATEIGGIWGFSTTTLLGEGKPKRPVLESSSKMTGLNRMFWDMDLGGAGGEVSEIYRRFIPKHRRMQEYNPFRNTMPTWMPGPEYFTDFRHGDPYSKIEKGELRLPGSGYESLNRLHPDFFGEYGALDRFKILADVAPYSDQYRYYSGVVSKMNNEGLIRDGDYKQVTQMRKLVSQKKERYDLHPYKFKYADIDKEEVTFLRWIDKDTFLTKEHPGNPIRMAGITMPSDTDESNRAGDIRKLKDEIFVPGEKITVGLDSDPINRVRDDTMGTMQGVVYDNNGESLNAKFARTHRLTNWLTGKESIVNPEYEDTSATSVNALYSEGEIKFGKKWEAFAHLDTPIHTKFLQIRSPLEMYKRKELYGKNWQTWSHPIQDWLKPTFEKFWSWNPITATAAGAGVGALMGTFAPSKKYFAIIGGLIGGLGSSARTVGDFANNNILQNKDHAWIPKRRQEERKIDEYFDMLQYVKYKGLYEKTRQIAAREEGVDPEVLAQYASRKSNSNSYLSSRLDKAKKWLKIFKNDPDTDEEEIKSRLAAVNEQLGLIDDNRELMNIGPLTTKALEYKQMYESTLYGADPSGDLMNIYRALPKKDKPFFKHFMLAAPEEREEILRLVPENQKRFYQAKWGLPIDRRQSLVEYFSKNKLPGSDWEGWKPGTSIEEVKFKFVAKEGLEVGEFGFWAEDTPMVKNAPRISNIFNGSALNISHLTKVLNGSGLNNIDITSEIVMLEDEPYSAFDISINVNQDRKSDVINVLNANVSNILAE